MSHEVESMMYVGETPWHGLGRRLENPPTSEEAIKAAGLDWEVGLKPMIAVDGMEMYDAIGYRAVMRSDSHGILGVVGTSWKPLQNRDAFRFFDPFIEAGAAEYHTAGSLKEGQKVWVLAKLQGEPMEIAKGDVVEKYLLLSNSHDGRYAVNVRFTPVRVVCWNTLTMAEGDGSAPYLKVYHRGNLTDTMEKVREVVDLTHRTFAATAEQYRLLARRNVQNLEKYIKTALGKDEEGHGKTPYALPKIQELFEGGRGQSNPAIRGTLWAAYNAVTEWVDHRRGTDAARLDAAWFGEGRRIKQRALQEAVLLAKAA